MVLLIVGGVGVWLALLGLAVVLCRAARLGDETHDGRAVGPAAVADEHCHGRAHDRLALARRPRSNAR